MKTIICALLLGLSAGLVHAKNMNCDKLGDEHARQNCRERQWDDKQFDHKDCKQLDSKDARKRCYDYQKDDRYYQGKRQTKEQYCGKKSGTRSQFDACMAQ